MLSPMILAFVIARESSVLFVLSEEFEITIRVRFLHYVAPVTVATDRLGINEGQWTGFGGQPYFDCPQFVLAASTAMGGRVEYRVSPSMSACIWYDRDAHGARILRRVDISKEEEPRTWPPNPDWSHHRHWSNASADLVLRRK